MNTSISGGQRFRSISPYWICQVLCWGGLMVLNCLDTRLLQDGDLRFLGINLFAYGLALFLSHLFRNFAQKARWSQLPIRQLLPKILLATVVLALIRTPVEMAAGVAFSPPEMTPLLWFFATLAMALVCLIEFLGWAGVYFGYQYYRQAQARRVDTLILNAELKDAHLRMLRMQINPHFLFNSLNTIRALIVQNPDQAREAVTQLAELLRTSLQKETNPLISLREELETVENYLALEKARFEQRLRIRRQIAPAALDKLLPPFLLQTLVENALKHGIAPLIEGGEVGIECNLSPVGELHLQVTNPGRIEPIHQREGTGTGLSNARARLLLLLGSQARLTVENSPAGGVIAEAHIPQTALANP